MKFTGSFDKLKEKVATINIDGEWVDNGNHKQFRTENGVFLNWWESTGKLLVQGEKGTNNEGYKVIFEYMLKQRLYGGQSKDNVEIQALHEEIKALREEIKLLIEKVAIIESVQNKLNERTMELTRFG